MATSPLAWVNDSIRFDKVNMTDELPVLPPGTPPAGSLVSLNQIGYPPQIP